MKSVKQSLFLVLGLFMSVLAYSQCPCWQFQDLYVGRDFEMSSASAFRIDAPNIDGGRFIVAPDGNVGLGFSITNLPTSKLHVKNGWITVDQYDAKSTLKILGNSSSNAYGWAGTSSNHPFSIGYNNNRILNVSTDGKVGIGLDNTVPAWMLDVKGEAGFLVGTMGTTPIRALIGARSDAAYIGTFSSHKLSLGTNNAAKMTIDVDGNVGIGASGTFDVDYGTLAGGRLRITPDGNVGININSPSPTAKLHVVGSSLFNGAVSIPGGGAGTANYIQLGADISGKEPAAGQIAYKKYTDGLDIVGAASTSINNRKVTFHSQGGIDFFAGMDGTAQIITKLRASGSAEWFGTTTNHSLILGTNNNSVMTITADGKIGIGTPSPGTYSLAVEGKMGARVIEVKATSWADFVFDKNYKLRSLKEVEDSININKHLPDVPSEEQVKRDGINVAKMDAILLQKIEELTLYVIEQNKRIEAIEKENTRLKKKANRQ